MVLCTNKLSELEEFSLASPIRIPCSRSRLTSTSHVLFHDAEDNLTSPAHQILGLREMLAQVHCDAMKHQHHHFHDMLVSHFESQILLKSSVRKLRRIFRIHSCPACQRSFRGCKANQSTPPRFYLLTPHSSGANLPTTWGLQWSTKGQSDLLRAEVQIVCTPLQCSI